MIQLRSCCLCFNLRTGSMVLSSLGIILGGLLLAPMVTFLDYHSYYVTQFVTAEREAGRTMDDDLVPHVAFFSKMFFSVCLVLDVLMILCCVMLQAGVAATRHLLIMPWLIFVFTIIVAIVTLLLAFMISLSDYASVAVFLATAPELLFIIYLWLVVYSCYQMIKKEEISRRGPQTGITTQSASHSSLSSFKENISRAIRGTPPPPYESVTSKPPVKPAQMKVSQQPSCSSLVDLLTSSKSSSGRQSPRSTRSNSRRSSDGQSSTKPASPVNSMVRKRHHADSALISPSKPISNSQSQQHICGDTKPVLRKSHSSMVSFQGKGQSGQDLLMKFSSSSLNPDLEVVTNNIKETENSELSDDTSSMSSTSLSIHDPKIV